MSAIQLVRLSSVLEKTGLKRSTFLKKVKSGEFAAPVRLSERNIAWRLVDVEGWINSRPTV